MTKNCCIIIFTCVFVFINAFSYSQGIWSVYWYNFPSDTVKIGDKNIETGSFFTFETDSASFDMEICAVSQNGETLCKRKLISDTKDYYISKRNKDMFRVEVGVPYLSLQPAYVLVKNNLTDEVMKFSCEYVSLSGHVRSENQSVKHVGIIPDGFDNRFTIYKRTYSTGYYQCVLPKRKYSFILGVDDKYAKSTLETWCYDMQLSFDKVLDFNISNGEIYNLHVWKNKGGGNSLFVAFRPMIIDKQMPESSKTFHGHCFQFVGNTVCLNPADLEISINGTRCNIITVQSFYETGTYTFALLSYLVQVDLNAHVLNRKTNELDLCFKINIKGNSYVANAKMNFDDDQL